MKMLSYKNSTIKSIHLKYYGQEWTK